MSISQNYPTSKPSLSLDFAKHQKLDPRITFTRTSSATRANSDGLVEVVPANEPRFDFDPSTGECLGLLVEEQRTNLLTPSIPDNVGVVNATVVTNSIISPSGELNASFLREDTSANIEHYKDYGPTLTSGVTYTFSVFYKAGPGNRNFAMRVAGINTAAQIVNVTNNTITSGTIVDYGNGWYRAYYSFTATATGATTVRLQLHNPYVYTGDGTSGVYLWGAQLEAGAFPTSYIPTTTTSVTRTPDNASITGTNFSGFYNPIEGTIYMSARRGYTGNFVGYPNLYAITDGTGNNSIKAYGVEPSMQFTNGVNAGGITQTDYVFANISTTNLFKSIYTFATNNSTFCVNGTLTTTDTSFTLPTVNRLNIGSSDTISVNPWNGTISNISYYPVRLSNSQLQTLTK